MLEAGKIVQISVDEIEYYCEPSDSEGFGKKLPNTLLGILLPIDNMVIQRKRLLRIFDYD